MTTRSKIEWTDVTWNPVRGCAIVSEGCENCYAMRIAHRFSGEGKPFEGLTRMTSRGPVWTGRARVCEETLEHPLHWRLAQRVFVNSMSDLFHEDVPEAFLDRMFGVMALTPHLTFQILTKRPERMREYVSRIAAGGMAFTSWAAHSAALARKIDKGREVPPRWPLPNVYLGISAENQSTLEARWPVLAQTPAAVRFISCEPLLESLNFYGAGSMGAESGDPCAPWSALRGYDGCEPPVPPIDWIIVGGESGPGARYCKRSWVASIVRQCEHEGVPVFVKQMGSVWARQFGLRQRANPSRPIHPKGEEMSEWPLELRVRRFPEASRHADAPGNGRESVSTPT